MASPGAASLPCLDIFSWLKTLCLKFSFLYLHPEKAQSLRGNEQHLKPFWDPWGALINLHLELKTTVQVHAGKVKVASYAKPPCDFTHYCLGNAFMND